MAIEISLPVKLQHTGIQGAPDTDDAILLKSGRPGGVDGGSSGIDNVPIKRFSRTAQKFQGHSRILPASDGNQHPLPPVGPGLFPEIPGQFPMNLR